MRNPAPTAFIGEPSTLGQDGRLQVPAQVRRAVQWLKGKKPVRLVAELVTPGYLRLYSAEQVGTKIEVTRQRLLDEHPGSEEHLAAFSDRYRQVSYYPSDGRVHFSQASAVFLRFAMTDDLFYIEARGEHISVMTLQLRNERLERLGPDLELPVDEDAE